MRLEDIEILLGSTGKSNNPYNTGEEWREPNLDFAETKLVDHSLNGTEAFNAASLHLARIEEFQMSRDHQPGFYEDEQLFRSY